MIVSIRRPIGFLMQKQDDLCEVELNFYIVLLSARLRNFNCVHFLNIVVRVDYFLQLNYLRYGTKDYLSETSLWWTVSLIFRQDILFRKEQHVLHNYPSNKPFISEQTCQHIYQLDALNFIIRLFQASTCFEHMCSSSGGQNCIIQSLVSPYWNKLMV